MTNKYTIRIIFEDNNLKKKLCWINRNRNTITFGFNFDKNKMDLENLHATYHKNGHTHYTERSQSFHFDLPNQPPLKRIKGLVTVVNKAIPIERIDKIYERYQKRKYDKEIIIKRREIINKNVLNIEIFLIEKGKDVLFDNIKKNNVIKRKIIKDINPWLGIIIS